MLDTLRHRMIHNTIISLGYWSKITRGLLLHLSGRLMVTSYIIQTYIASIMKQ